MWKYYTFSSAVCLVNPLHPNISVYILHTVLYTIPEVLIVGHFLYSWTFMVNSVVILWGEIRSYSMLDVKGINKEFLF